MFKFLKPALRLLLFMTVLTGALYPLAVTELGRLCFPSQANGSIVYVDGRPVGSSLIGQSFSSPRYFHPRPSAAGEGYDGSLSGATNLGPTSLTLNHLVTQRIQAFRSENSLSPSMKIPADMVTASASGLDPHISPAAAALQVDRVARARGLTREQVQNMVDECTEPRILEFLGQERVNVLKLNLMLDSVNK